MASSGVVVDCSYFVFPRGNYGAAKHLEPVFSLYILGYNRNMVVQCSGPAPKVTKTITVLIIRLLYTSGNIVMNKIFSF